MGSVIYDEAVASDPHDSPRSGTQLVTSDVANDYSETANRAFVGRPGCDLGTLGLKGIFRWLRGVALVDNSLLSKRNGVVSCQFGFVAL